jgi:hypothetical protein
MTGSPWWDSNPHLRLSQDRSLSVEIQRRPLEFSKVLNERSSKVSLWINSECGLTLDVSTIHEMIFLSQDDRNFYSFGRAPNLSLFFFVETRGTVSRAIRG